MNSTTPPSLATLGGHKPKRKYTRHNAGGITVQKGIELPPASPTHKYPWKMLEVGDSFFVANAPKSLAGSISKRNKDGPTEYAIRKWKEGSLTGVRVWRTK
jgi:hypothetical protein